MVNIVFYKVDLQETMSEQEKGKELSKIQRRLIETHVHLKIDGADIDDAIFQHSILCQTFLPYRNPGTDNAVWQQKQGNAMLAIQAGNLYNPSTDKFEFVGLPYGTKARLILAHVNSEAIKSQSPIVDVEDSMTAFIRKIGLHTDGRTIRSVKEQLRRLTTSTISMGFTGSDDVGFQVDLKIIKAFDLWFPKDERQRVLWNSTIQLTNDYFESLMNHAIPLDDRALAALSHNAMALDIYAWLAQRLHRISPHKPQFVAWANMKEQFGFGYRQMRKFKQVFRKTLKDVLLQYPDARVEEKDNKGLLLYNSAPPIPTKVMTIGDGSDALKALSDSVQDKRKQQSKAKKPKKD